MLETVITSSILIAAIIILRIAFCTSVGRRARYALWGLVLLRLLMPFSFAKSPVSIMNAVDTNSLSLLGEHQLPVMPIGISQSVYTTEYSADAGTMRADTQAPLPAEIDWLDISLKNGLILIWAVGMAAVAAWFLAINRRFGASLKANRRASPPDISKLPVYVAHGLSSPCLFGLMRPAIYLTPEALETSETKSHVLLHEETHYCHGDHIWALLRIICLVVYWFNPLVWVAAWLSRIDCEQACDEAVVRHIGAKNRAAYGHTLLNMIDTRPTPKMLVCTATTMAAGKRHIRRRIAAIARNRKTVTAALLAMILSTAALVGCTFFGAMAAGEDYTADSALHTLFDSVSADSGIFSFTIPKSGFQAEDWRIQLAGRLEIEGFGGMSIHPIDPADENNWQPGQEYTIELDAFDDISELIMTATLQGQHSGFLTMTFDNGVLLSTFKQVGTSVWKTEYSLNRPVQLIDDEIITQAIMAHTGDTDTESFKTAAFTLLHYDEADTTATAYIMALYTAFRANDGLLEQVSGSHMPVAMTFGKDASGGMALTEYWTPQDGAYYASSIKAKFPAEIHDIALDTQRFVQAHLIAAYQQAGERFGIDMQAAATKLIDAVCADYSGYTRPISYLEPGYLAFRECLNYGQAALDYAVSQLELGGQTGARGQVLADLCRHLLRQFEQPVLEGSFATGQEWYDAQQMNIF